MNSLPPSVPSSENQKEKLLELPKEQLVNLLLSALEAVSKCTENMQVLGTLLQTLQKQNEELKDRQMTLEAELAELRARP